METGKEILDHGPQAAVRSMGFKYFAKHDWEARAMFLVENGVSDDEIVVFKFGDGCGRDADGAGDGPDEGADGVELRHGGGCLDLVISLEWKMVWLVCGC